MSYGSPEWQGWVLGEEEGTISKYTPTSSFTLN